MFSTVSSTNGASLMIHTAAVEPQGSAKILCRIEIKFIREYKPSYTKP